MADIRKFNSYNFVTGAVDGTLAYDFTNPAVYPQEETVQEPARQPNRRARKQERLREREWIKEETADQAREERIAARNRQGVSLLSLAGAIVVIVLLTMMLLAQIRLTDISNSAAALETRINELELEKDKLTVEYETIFNLKSVEEYATNILGMQEPEDDQIFYLTGVTSADKAVVITKNQTDMFGLGLEDLTGSLMAFWEKVEKAYLD